MPGAEESRPASDPPSHVLVVTPRQVWRLSGAGCVPRAGAGPLWLCPGAPAGVRDERGALRGVRHPSGSRGAWFRLERPAKRWFSTTAQVERKEKETGPVVHTFLKKTRRAVRD